MAAPNNLGFLRQAGDFSKWNVYRKSVIVSDVTELFVRRHMTYSKKTEEQMRQAARSCKQNIVEGVTDGAVSVELCIKLLGVAKGSLRELLEDYGDFLRQNGLETWAPTDPRTRQTRRYCKADNDPATFVKKCSERSAETIANIMLTQCRQLDTMLSAVLRRVERDFLASGGIKEKMSATRRQLRGY